MERKEFITLLGMGAGAVIVTSCLGACGGKDSETTPSGGTTGGGTTGGAKIDFTLNVATNQDILSKGWTIMQGVIIAKNGANYIALQGSCTHQGNQMTYDPGSNRFPCSLQTPDHGSIFNADGVKISGPATSNLKKYSTTLTGNDLRVFEV